MSTNHGSRGMRRWQVAAVSLLVSTPVLAGNAGSSETIFAVVDTLGIQTLISLETSNPGQTTQVGLITGLEPGETVLGLDLRPATGMLYALGSTSRLYTIDPDDASATVVSAAPFSVLLEGEFFGFDFNPQIDRIRVVSDADQNLVLNPETGALQLDATAVFYAAGDPNEGMNPTVVHHAYDNNVAGTMSTQLRAVDADLDILATQANNAGTLATIGALGEIFSPVGGFDVSGETGIGYAISTMQLPLGLLGASTLYTVDLSTGAITEVGVVDAGLLSVVAMTVVPIPEPPLPEEIIFAISDDADGGQSLISFETNAPATATSIGVITGLQKGEVLLSLDFRPLTCQLYALGASSRIYTIDRDDATATEVGMAPFSTLLDGEFFGFDFNPQIDRIRVVSDADQNLVLNPITGALQLVATPVFYAAGDPNEGAEPMVVHHAYDNNVAGTMSTQLRAIDVDLDILVTQANNAGTLATIGALGVDFSPIGGFDVSGETNTGYAVSTGVMLGVSTFYAIDLASGAASEAGTIGSVTGGSFAVSGMTVYPPNDCPGDLNGDGMVDGADVGILLAAWMSTADKADFNGDNTVDGEDLGILLGNWGPCSAG